MWAACACIACGERDTSPSPRRASTEEEHALENADSGALAAETAATELPLAIEIECAADAGSLGGTLSERDAAVDAGADIGADAGADIGADAGVKAPPSCPEAMAQVGRFCVDRYEAHLATLTAEGEAQVFSHTQRPRPGARYEARSAPGVFPQAYINRNEAKAACKNAGKRLCSMVEWRRACQGSRWMTYPYGSRRQEGSCNTGKPHLLQQRFGSDPRLWKYDEHFNSPQLNEEPGFLAKAGAYETCTGDTGLYDMVGNLHEWVSDTVDDALIERLAEEDVSRHKQPWREGNGVFMGGFFSTTGELGPGCKYVTVAHEPAYHDYSTGFRCCAPARESGPRRVRSSTSKPKPNE